MSEDGPMVGVTRWEDVPGEAVDRYWARVREAGGRVLDLDESSASRIGELAPQLDALMLTGGVDVDPSRYRVPRHERVRQTHPERDAMELAYLEGALRRDIPVLAICRGHQLLNVAFGGALLPHIDSGEHRADYRTAGYPSRWHSVHVVEGSRLVEALGGPSFETNSRHHQGVRAADLGAGLRAVAFADDPAGQLVEGVESEGHPWVVGVQWHPERTEGHKPEFAPRMRLIFDAFVAASVAPRAAV